MNRLSALQESFALCDVKSLVATIVRDRLGYLFLRQAIRQGFSVTLQQKARAISTWYGRNA